MSHKIDRGESSVVILLYRLKMLWWVVIRLVFANHLTLAAPLAALLESR